MSDARHLPWPDSSVQTVVTSPPYWGQRDYGFDGQIGMEPTYVEYVDALVDVAREARRYLRPDGTLWLNLGDTFNTRAVIRGSSHQGGLGHDNANIRLTWAEAVKLGKVRYSARQPGLKDKDLMLLPYRVADALVRDGWFLRCDVVWSKPWGAPENAADRPSRSHESLLLLSPSSRYFYDKAACPDARRSVWEIPVAAADDSTDHSARFPDELVRRCVLSTSRPGDVVADPFGGSNTTARVATTLDRIGWSNDADPRIAALLAGGDR
mgnify:CR=1 FL=1